MRYWYIGKWDSKRSIAVSPRTQVNLLILWAVLVLTCLVLLVVHAYL